MSHTKTKADEESRFTLRKKASKRTKVDLAAKTRLQSNDGSDEDLDLPFSDARKRSLKGGETSKENKYEIDSAETDESIDDDEDGAYGSSENDSDSENGSEYGDDVETRAETDEEWTVHHSRLAQVNSCAQL